MSEDVLEIRARVECRDWMMAEIANYMMSRSPIVRMTDEATGYQNSQLELLATLCDDNAADLELLGHDGSKYRERAAETRELTRWYRWKRQ